MTTHSNIMAMIDDYVDEIEHAQTTGNFVRVREMYINLSNKIKDLCNNQVVIVSELKYVPIHHKHPVKQSCDCDEWGCQKCCSSEQEIRSRQGTFR